MEGGKLVSKKSWWGKKLVHREEYIPVKLKITASMQRFVFLLQIMLDLKGRIK